MRKKQSASKATQPSSGEFQVASETYHVQVKEELKGLSDYAKRARIARSMLSAAKHLEHPSVHLPEGVCIVSTPTDLAGEVIEGDLNVAIPVNLDKQGLLWLTQQKSGSYEQCWYEEHVPGFLVKDPETYVLDVGVVFIYEQMGLVLARMKRYKKPTDQFEERLLAALERLKAFSDA